MNADNMTADQWTDQQHAQALEALKNDGTSMHDQLCMFAMLEGWSKSHRKIIEKQMREGERSD